ncbi:MAG: TlpA family protein disulfide reductase [Coxiellaceae bacterium]|nr:TlpA family protein disulfide reductase [Coxiellaceae bacterium]
MKRALTLLICLFNLILLSACSSQADTKDSKGHAIRLSNYEGKWVVVNYWATWCKPCLTEIPTLNAIYQGNRDRVMVIGVSYDKLNNEEINQVAKQWAVQFPMTAQFPLEKLNVQRLDVLPITFIFNPDGKLVKTLRGPQTETQFKTALNL